MEKDKFISHYNLVKQEVTKITLSEPIDFKMEQIEYDTDGNILSCVVSYLVEADNKLGNILSGMTRIYKEV